MPFLMALSIRFSELISSPALFFQKSEAVTYAGNTMEAVHIKTAFCPQLYKMAVWQSGIANSKIDYISERVSDVLLRILKAFGL